MKSLFTKLIITSFCFLFSSGSSFAQAVKYTVQNEEKTLGVAIFHYKESGNYEAVFGKIKILYEIKPHGIVETSGNFSMTTFLSEGDKYYHEYYHLWRTTLVTTSKGEKGFAMVRYEGDTKEGRSYYSEIWIGAEMISKNRTVVDIKGRIVSKATIDDTGFLFINRE